MEDNKAALKGGVSNPGFSMKKIEKAVTKVLISHPFYATLLLSLSFKEDPECDTLWTDGVSLGFNPQFIEQIAPGSLDRCNLDTLEAALIHEAHHLVLLHQFRLKNRDAGLWNRACDYVVNQALKDYGLEIPADWLLDARFRNYSEDKVYGELNKPQPPAPTPQPASGEIRPHPNPTQQAQQEWVQTVQRAMIAGKASEDTKRAFKELTEPTVPLIEILLRVFEDKKRGGYNHQRPNRRYPHFFLPERKTKQLSKTLIAIDTSGSVDEELLGRFNADLLKAMKLLNLESLDIAYCDTQIRIDSLTADGCLNPIGGGGTDYAPVFAHAEQEQYPKVIYLTDGHCDSFGNYFGDAFWVIYADNQNFNPPFGEVYYWRQNHV